MIPVMIQNDSGESSTSNEWVTQHNKYRIKRNLSPLSWNDDLAKSASNWAKQLTSTNSFSHGDMNSNSSICKTGKCGQNLSKGIIGDIPSVVQSWVSCECKNFTGKPNPEAGHYTQVMWPSTKYVGCAESGDITACNYNVGNEVSGGMFTEVVPQGSCGTTPEMCKRGQFG